MAWVSCIYLPPLVDHHTHFLLTIITHVGGSNRNNYISPSNIRASTETRPPKLHNLLQFSPPSIPDILWASPPPPPSHPRLGSRGSAIHVFPVNLDV